MKKAVEAGKAVGPYEVVINAVKPITGDSGDDWEANNQIVSEAIVILIQVVTKPIMTIIGRIRGSTPDLETSSVSIVFRYRL